MNNFDTEEVYKYLKRNNVVVNTQTKQQFNEYLDFIEEYYYLSDDYYKGWEKYNSELCHSINANRCVFSCIKFNKKYNHKIITFQELKDMFPLHKFLNWNQLQEGVEYEGYINDSKQLEFRWIGQFAYTKYNDEYGYSTGRLTANELFRMKFKPLSIKQPKEMTLTEVCEELGYDIKIVKEE